MGFTGGTNTSGGVFDVVRHAVEGSAGADNWASARESIELPVAETMASVLDGTYPLSRPLNMISDGQPAGSAKAYIDWILGADGQKIVADMGFVPLSK